jgi:uncharacterized Zn-binding protein involved in type VI secretion
MGDQAARDDDPSQCPHSGFRLQTIATRGVNINSCTAAKTLDASGCAGRFIVTGSGTVRINSQPAARAHDYTTDGAIVLGSSNVMIGGPRAGATAGSVAAQKQACQNAASSRSSGSTGQSYGNCGLESWRNVINKRRAERSLPPVTEDELMKKATGMGLAGNDPVNKPWSYGATSASGRTKILKEYGLETQTAPQSIESIRDAVEGGRAVSMSFTPYHWGGNVTKDWLHEVAVTGIEYDANGKIAAFIVNDTGLGVCADRISIADMKRNLRTDLHMTVSKDRVW